MECDCDVMISVMSVNGIIVGVYIVSGIASKNTPEEVLQQYFGYMYFFQDALEEALQTPIYYTLGYVDYERRPVFYTSKDKLKCNLGNPMSGV
ncbi:Uncharacterised protein [Serratia plymuthica]|nr:Uncharacterised protein [Serratia plymuthica]